MIVSITYVIFITVIVLLFYAYIDAERECRHMKVYSVRKPGVKYIRISFLRKIIKKYFGSYLDR